MAWILDGSLVALHLKILKKKIYISEVEINDQRQFKD
jgi:hypothetical protein